jgi:hypothetical protein
MLSAIVKQSQIPWKVLNSVVENGVVKGYAVQYDNGYKGVLDPQGVLISADRDNLYEEEIVGSQIMGYTRVINTPVNTSGSSSGSGTNTGTNTAGTGTGTTTTPVNTAGGGSGTLPVNPDHVEAGPLDWLKGSMVAGVPNWVLLVGAVFLLKGK